MFAMLRSAAGKAGLAAALRWTCQNAGRGMRTATLHLTIAMLALAGTAAAEGWPVAGTQPDQRPQGAPVITEFTRDGAWYEQALHGVDQPYPASLKFLEDQGAWFTPFIHAGMPGPYDIRHWHDNE